MGINRLFWPQELLDQWIVDEKISMEGDSLTLVKEDKSYAVTQGVYFDADVGDGDDKFHLVGRVKALDELEGMGAECYMDSVIIEDSAYQTVSGFLGVPADGENLAQTRPRLHSVSASLEDDRDDKELLAKFLIDNL